MTRILTQSLIVALLLLIPGLPITAEVILDDDFNGTTLNRAVWGDAPWGDSPATGAYVSGGRLYLDASPSIAAYNVSGNFINMALYGVQNSSSNFSFGFMNALGGWVYLLVADNGETTLNLHWGWSPWQPPGHTTQGPEAINLGTSSEGDFEIDWEPSLLRVVNNGQVLYYTDDPMKVPYYYAMGPFSLYSTDGNVSVDRVVLTTPEPATLLLVAFGALFRGGILRKKGSH